MTLTRFARSRLSTLCATALLSIYATACEHRPRAEVTVEDLGFFAKTLADPEMRGREAGTEPARAATAFVTRQFERLGLAPAFGDSFEQKFTFKAGRAPGKNNRYEFQPLPAVRGADFKNPLLQGVPEPLPFSEPGTVTGDLVFLGFCLSAPDWNDFAGQVVKDRVLLCLRHGPGGPKNEKFAKYMSFQAKYEAAHKAGARGVLFLGRAGTEPISAGDIGANPGKGPVTLFAEPGPMLQAVSFLRETEEKMLKGEKSPRAGETLGTITLQSDHKPDEREATNTGAYLYPPGPQDRVVIVGAHRDHIGNGSFSSMGKKGEIHFGADDNASGVAVLLEAAGALAGGPRLPAGTNVLFLTFDAEERGLFGSRHFAESSASPGKRAVAMINLDMVGRLRARKGLSVQGADTADERWKQSLEKAFGAAGFPPGVELKLIRGGYGPSDHSSFYKKDIPVAFLFTGGHREYHTERDTIDLLNLEGMRPIVNMTVGIVREASAYPQPLAFRKAPAEPQRSAFSFKVRLGVMPGNYDTDAEGLEVGEIRDDAPIARSGIRKGDVIVQIDDLPIRNIQDVMTFLSDASLKTPYKIVYKRGDRRLETTTELMSWE